MTLNGSLAPTLLTCLSTALFSTGCAPNVSAIKARGQIAPEALPADSDPPLGRWTRGCLEEGGRVHGELDLSVAEAPAYDLSRFAFRTEGFLLHPDVGAFKAGRVIGRLVVVDPNDATLKAMDDYTAEWNEDASHARSKLAWRRDAGSDNLWRSVRMVFQLEKAGRKGSFHVSPLNDRKPYEPLYPDGTDADRKARLFSFRELETVAPSLVPPEAEIMGWFLPAFQGLVTFEAEAVETYREDGSPAGCVAVARAD